MRIKRAALCAATMANSRFQYVKKFELPDALLRDTYLVTRFKLWWLKPSHGQSGLDVPPETSLLLAEISNTLNHSTNRTKEYAILLPLSDTHARTSLHRAGAAGNSAADASALALTADTGDSSTALPDEWGVMLVATGPDPFRLARRMVSKAVERLREQLEPSAGVERMEEEEPAKTLPAAKFADAFGWCTWDSMYTMVTPEGVLEGLSGFHARGVRPRWVVIDDGWQRTTNDDALNTEQWAERLVELVANKRFRRYNDEGRMVLDLGDTVKKMKIEYRVEQVLMWHAITGYWAGVEPEAEEMQLFHPFAAKLLAPEGIRQVDPEMQPELDEKRFGMVPSSHVEAFYRTYHAYLKDNGVDGVKVDAQSVLDCMGGGNGGVPAVTAAYHEALHRSVEASFKDGDKPAAIVHCMCHAPSVLYHIGAVSQDEVVIRGSDDFYPREPSSHGPHLYTNAYTSLLISNLGLQDWDMFQSGLGSEANMSADSRPSSEDTGEGLTRVKPGDVDAKVDKEEDTTLGTKISWFHAAARSISGGPVYVSDRLGQHNTDILDKIVLNDGSVLRARTNALPTLDCLMRDPQVDGGGLLQIWSLNTLPGTGIVGSFNVRGAAFSESERTWVKLEDGDVPPVKGAVSPSDIHAFNNMETLEQVAGVPANKTHIDEGVRKREALTAMRGSGIPEPIYAMYLHCRKEARVVRLTESTPLEIDVLGFELATFSRILELGCPPHQAKSQAPGSISHDPSVDTVRWAAIGLPDMLNSSGAILNQEVVMTTSLGDDQYAGMSLENDPFRGIAVSALVKGSGRFLALASHRPDRVGLKTKATGDGLSEGVDNDVVLEMSFKPVAGKGKDVVDSTGTSGDGEDTANDDPESVDGWKDMEIVQVDIPKPWDGRETWLVFSWT